MYCSSFLCLNISRTNHSPKIPCERIWSFSTQSHSVEAFMLTKALTLPSSCQHHHRSQHPWELNENVTTLKVCIISISVLIISVGKLGVLLAVWDSAKRRVVVETCVKDLVDYLLCLLTTNFPHSQDGAEGAASDTFLFKEIKWVQCEIKLKPAKTCYIYPSAGTWWCCFKPKFNLATSLLKEQSPLRFAARIWNDETKKSLSSQQTKFVGQ